MSAKAQGAMARFRNATDFTNMRDREAPPLPQEPLCTRANRLQAGSPVAQHELFRTLKLSVWRRVYAGELVDNVIIALCTLMATAAAGAAILRLVRWRKHAGLTVFSLRRELAYTSIFALAQLRCGRLCARGKRASCCSASANSSRLRFSKLLRIICTAAVPAAALWLVIEV